ncbi:transcriptional regulator [Azorhizobium oxalatiphilum]|uniref:Transcriptional regulator n=2 Tax=Azorhizobium oxalatiphilum TaxID=980631 RepID=A0A917BV41_9HYPH|nr:transcriptional regulator [Azorhizobium oxalatiphilum]
MMVAGTVTDAAALMGVTQPAVSRMLRDLQSELGLRLFERHGMKLVPTNEGLTLYAEVARSFVGLERIAQVAREVKERRAGVVRVSSMPALMNGFLPRFVGSFLRERPKMDLSLHGASSPLVLEQILSGQSELGFAMGPLDHAGVIALPMPAARMQAALPEGHPLLEKAVIHVSDLHGQDYVALDGGRSRMRMDRLLDVQGVRPVLRAETTLSGIVCGIVASGLGISVCDPYTLREFENRGVVARPFEPAMAFEFSAVRSAQRSFPAIAKSLLDAFRAHTTRFLAERDCLLSEE